MFLAPLNLKRRLEALNIYRRLCSMHYISQLNLKLPVILNSAVFHFLVVAATLQVYTQLIQTSSEGPPFPDTCQCEKQDQNVGSPLQEQFRGTTNF